MGLLTVLDHNGHTHKLTTEDSYALPRMDPNPGWLVFHGSDGSVLALYSTVIASIHLSPEEAN